MMDEQELDKNLITLSFLSRSSKQIWHIHFSINQQNKKVTIRYCRVISIMLTKSLAPIASHPKLKGARDTFREANGDSMVLIEPAPKTADRKDDGVWILTMNRLKSKNALSDEMFLVLSDALNELANDERVKLVIITGKTEFFSSGADLTPGANDPNHLKSGKDSLMIQLEFS